MPFSVSNEHIQYFKINGKIEFENLLNLNQLKIFQTFLSEQDPSKSHGLAFGYDLWRSNPSLKGLICNAKWATIVGQLTNRTKVRHGYSQYIDTYCHDASEPFLARKHCLKELICGICICIDPASEAESPFFPENAGSAMFFRIDSEFLLKFPRTTGKYLFIFFVDFKARFYWREEDSFAQRAFKKLGYSNGDFLKNSINPAFENIIL